jgi:Kdo2-lipid IVA lauroyltransferase/acyltransferase
VLIDLLLILIIKSIQQAIRILPEGAQTATGVFFGRLAFGILTKRRAVAISNVKRAFSALSNGQASDIAKRSFEKMGVNFVEQLMMPYIPRGEYATRFPVENQHYIDDALKQNKGAIGLIFHYANWEIMGVASTPLSSPVVVLARPLKRRKLLNQFLNDLRSSAGLKIIPNANTAKDVIRYLRENRIVGILADQREKRSKAVFVELFGEKVPTNKGIAAIGMKTGAPVVPMYLAREGFLRYRVVWNEPIEMERKGDIEDLIYRNTRKINAFLESIILKQPDEWFWVHRRWGSKRK